MKMVFFVPTKKLVIFRRQCVWHWVNPHRLRANMEITMVYPMVYAIFCYDHPQKFAQNCCLSQGFRQWPAAPGAPEQEWIAIKVQPFK